MFSLIADLLTTVTTILFPIFASYKALRTSDPSQLTPWLMYWVIFSIAVLFENTFSFVLTWIPFYSWLRFFGHLYLVKPGGTQLYQLYVHPFLTEHEHDIDTFITGAHDRAKAVGFQYLKQAVEWIKVNAMGLQPRPQTPPASRHGSYAQQFLRGFNLPTAREGFAAPAGDFYGLLASALQMSTSTGATRDMQAAELSASGTLIPAGIQSTEERMNYVSTQRERLRVLLQAFDKEASDLAGAPPSPQNTYNLSREKSNDGHMSKSKSEADFDKIEKEEVHGQATTRPTSGGWMPWNWGSAASASPAAQAGNEASHTEISAKSSGVDL